jgi:hypothetical protein
MSSPTFGVFLDSLVNQKAMISSDATFLPAYISSMLSPIQDLMVPEHLHERLFGPFVLETPKYVIECTLLFLFTLYSYSG